MINPIKWKINSQQPNQKQTHLLHPTYIGSKDIKLTQTFYTPPTFGHHKNSMHTSKVFHD